MSSLITFTVTLTPAQTVPVQVDYTTVDETATSFADYVLKKGTLVFNPGMTSQIVSVRVIASTAVLASKKFKLVLSNAVQCVLGTASSEAVISGPPVYAAVPFPGRRAALIGDSITYANHHWNPAARVGTDTPAVMRNAYYGTGATGFFTYANALLGNALELEPALQPNTNPGANATSPNNGYNFAVYSSQVGQWMLADFDPITEAVVAHNIGPMYNALNLHLAAFDIAIIMGGTNDLSGGLPIASIVNGLMLDAYNLASAGKWVFMQTITPRSGDFLGPVNGVGGFTAAQQSQIMLNIQAVNAQLRTWLTPTASYTSPPNIFLVDHYAALLGPTASYIAGNPTDPAGLLSSTTSTPPGVSSPGNYRTDAPLQRFCYDGLHLATAGGYVAGKILAAAMKAAGVPAAISGQLGPLSIGPNLMISPNMPISTTPRVAGAPLLLGRSLSLGAPLHDATHPAPTAPLATDAFANVGLGYTFGQVPDHFFIYRNSNSDGESYSNFNAYIFSSFVGAQPSLAPYMVDSTWASGALVASVVAVAGLPGVNALKLVFNAPSGLTHQEGFTVRYLIAEGQHGAWDNYGFETGATATTVAPTYTPGQAIGADCVIDLSGMTPNLASMRFSLNFLSINNVQVNAGDVSTSSAVIAGIALSESYFPFSHIADNTQHPENKVLSLRAPAVIAPTPASGETQVLAQLNWQFTWDCSSASASATILIYLPRIAVLTGPAL